MGIGTMITFITLSNITKIGKEVTEVHQPAAYKALELTMHMNKATTKVNDYLLTKDNDFKNEFIELKRLIIESYNNNHMGFKHNPNHELGILFTKYFDLVDRLYALSDSDIDNFPGLALAIEKTDPHTLAYLGLLNEALNEEYEDLSASETLQVITVLNDLRYSWIQMNNAFRIFISTRSDNDIDNFYSYSEVNGDLHKKIRATGFDIGFGTLDQLEHHRSERLKNVPKVVDIFQNVGWRQDLYLLKTEVYPLLNRINQTLENHADQQVRAASKDSEELSALIQRTSIIIVAILILGLVITISIAIVVQKGVKPLFTLAKALQFTSIKKPMALNKDLLSLDNEIGYLARAFEQMNQNLIRDLRELEKAETKFQVLLSSSPNATIIIDRAGRINLFNREAERIFGYDEAEVIGKPIEKLLPERFIKGHSALLNDFMENPTFRSIDASRELSGLHKNGEEFPVEINLAPIEIKDGLLVSASIRDITVQKEAEKRLLHQANYDTLTDLPNRILVIDRLEQAIISAKRKNKVVAIMFIDLDQFKNVNDTLGHTVGDKLLCAVAERLLECVRAYDTVARLGGDEFLMILPDLNNLIYSEHIADKVISSLSHPFNIDKRDLYISASIGITGFPNDGDDPEALFRKADAAMYQAKDAGRSTYRFFTDDMNALLLKRLDIESRLRVALLNDELYLDYQPQVSLTTNKMVGAEALLRWKNPTLGLVDTEEFIPIAEETGIIGAIGDWVLEQACIAAHKWQKISKDEIRLTINISAVQFRVGDLVNKIKSVLERTHLPAHLLELEITERILVEDNPNTSRILNDLKRLGIRLSLDDFGKGYSSLSYLKQFPFDVLKIDKSFVTDLGSNNENTSLCKAIVAMSESLNLEVIGEGVETAVQYHSLCEMGADSAQGYFFNKPMSDHDFEKLLQSPTLTRVI